MSGKLVGGALAAAVVAVVAACFLPMVVSLVQSQYRFDLQSYWEVFVHRHHNVATWTERGWPYVVTPISVLLAPFAGGFVLGRLGGGGFNRILLFAFVYAALVILLGALAGMQHPYPFNWSAYPAFLGTKQIVTLLVVAVVLGAVGVSLGRRGRGSV